MKKAMFALLIVAALCVFTTSVAFAGSSDGYGYMSPAPASGDCNPDGSGFDGVVGDGRGPAPNAGAGTSDGSGF